MNNLRKENGNISKFKHENFTQRVINGNVLSCYHSSDEKVDIKKREMKVLKYYKYILLKA